jgi:CRP/FNR family cyclic AMP-dependent transcriptional regulator
MGQMNSLIRVLGQVPVFQSLSKEELQALAAVACRQNVAAGETVFHTGTAGEAMYVIEAGSLKICRFTTTGRERIIRVLGPGEVIGEMALFDDEPRSADAVSLEDTGLIRVSKQDFLDLLEEIPLLAIRFLQVLAARLRRMNEKLEELTFLTARRRVARLLLELTEEEAREGPQMAVVHLKLTQEEMAALIGTSRETVSRILSELQESGVVSIEERILRVKQWDKLQTLSQVDGV